MSLLYKTNFKNNTSNRKIGVSGMMRVKNDAEFIEACVESCIDALDELVIVYNECTDDSPNIIKEMALKYPKKIRAFEYKHKISAWNLDEDIAAKIINTEFLSESTLAEYYNYTLSKTSYQYVMKIDADQIYNSVKLKEICDCYRIVYKNKLQLYKTVYIFLISLLLSLSVRFKLYIPIICNKKTYYRYFKYLKQYISKYKPDSSMSGINIIYDNDNNIYVSLGQKIKDGVNILPPYNGEGDHPIFRVTRRTYFIPKIDIAYNDLNKCGISVIEQLVGLRKLWILGPYWVHLNACRLNIYDVSVENLKKFPNSFVSLDEFYNNKLKYYWNNIDNSIFGKTKKIFFSFIHAGIDKDFISFFDKKQKVYG